MTNEELKKLSRAELLEILVRQQEKIEGLEAELQNTKKALEDRQIRIDESGSIAEAALKISGVFEAAQQAADLYLENVKMKAPRETLQEAEVPGSKSTAQASAAAQPAHSWDEEARAQRIRVAKMLADQEKKQNEKAQMKHTRRESVKPHTPEKNRQEKKRRHLSGKPQT